MAFRRTANAKVVQPQISEAGWSRVRGKVAASRSLVAQASEILGKPFSPAQYLLTHATIVASVDTEAIPGIKTGAVVEGGKKINRKYADYRVTAETEPLVNNNHDCFSRGVIKRAWSTFIGGHNFCFAPGTPIQLADGTLRAIEEIREGDVVVTHTGAHQAVTHCFAREYVGEVSHLYLNRYQTPIIGTPNHPFYALAASGEPSWQPLGSLVPGQHLQGTQDQWSVQDLQSHAYQGMVYNLEVAGDNSYVVGPGVAVHNCEHVQVEELSKGRIIDAVIRDLGHSLYVDILVATDRKHTELVADIESGKMNAMSMGCNVVECQCTKCGNVAVDETDMCDCVRYHKGDSFIDEKGQRRRIAELCGHESLDPTGGVTFFEASWVANPAFKGAVMRNILEPSAALSKRTADILSRPPKKWAAQGAVRKAGFDFSAPEEEAEAAPETAPAKSDLSKLEDDVKKDVLQKVERSIRDEMKGPQPGPEDSSSVNDNLIREASWQETYRDAVVLITRVASSPKEALVRVAGLDRHLGVQVRTPVYRAAYQTGPRKWYSSDESYLAACQRQLGGACSHKEAQTFLRLGRILNHVGGVPRHSVTGVSNGTS